MTIERKYSHTTVSTEKLSKDQYCAKYFDRNKAFRYALKTFDGNDSENLLSAMRERYLLYRTNWRALPDKAIEKGWGRNYVQETQIPPMCIDLELASICNLACPFCYRQFIATPDKMMDIDLAYKMIDEAAALKVPSIKFNWRGEPTLYPKLLELIDYAKKKGILETLVNSNATKLNREYCEKLVDAGLDVLIYSFDGGSEKSYNKMRPGRWEDNQFKDIYRNIRTLHEVKVEKKSPFPFTRIQMIVTKETLSEKQSFMDLFNDCVDEVTTIAYMERGGNLDTLSEQEKSALTSFSGKGVGDLDPSDFWKDIDGQLFMQTGRKPCEQPFQRIMISYDGRAFMCCQDWGNEHPIGYVSNQSFEQGDSDYDEVYERSASNKKGYELMSLEMPNRNIKIPKKVQSLEEIWKGPVVSGVRELHVRNKVNSVEVCKNCTAKSTYNWEKLKIEETKRV